MWGWIHIIIKVISYSLLIINLTGNKKKNANNWPMKTKLAGKSESKLSPQSNLNNVKNKIFVRKLSA